jgi:hypothetical protein
MRIPKTKERLMKNLRKNLIGLMEQISQGKKTRIRPRYGDKVHFFELQNRIIGSLLLAPAMHGVITASAKSLGRYLVDGFAEKEKILSKLKRYYKNAGIGILEVVQFTPKLAVFRIRECAECFGIPKLGVPTCYYELGFISGVTAGILGRETEEKETRCIGNGDEWCEFIIKAQEV